MIPTVRSLASGMSVVMNLTPLSLSVSRSAALRDSRSSFAMSSVAPVDLGQVQRPRELRRFTVARRVEQPHPAQPRGAFRAPTEPATDDRL